MISFCLSIVSPTMYSFSSRLPRGACNRICSADSTVYNDVLGEPDSFFSIVGERNTALFHRSQSIVPTK